MCIIIDANAAGSAFAEPPSPDHRPIWKWLLDGNGKLVYGGKLERELGKIESARRRLLKLWRDGKAIRRDDDAVTEEEAVVAATNLCKSNDPHVIALARESGTRVVCTGDKALHADIKNRKLLDKPRGSIYQKAGHRRKLRHCTSCPGR